MKTTLEQLAAKWREEARNTLDCGFCFGQMNRAVAEREMEMASELERAIAEQWQPIETAPKDGTVILAVSDLHIKEDWYPDLVGWCDGWVYSGNFNEVMFNLSHWMHMPTLPAAPTPPKP